MFIRIHPVALLVAFGITQPVAAGYYSTIDSPEEMRLSRFDYRGVFRDTIDNLGSIGDDKSPKNPPIRRRYLMIEALARDRILKLETLEQKLNYSTVLIRRNRAEEAVQFLMPVVREHPENFLVLAHYASAHFLSSSNDFKIKSRSYMREALAKWPKTWAELTEEDKNWLLALGWEVTAFERNRRYEVCFKRLIDNRLDEDKRRARKEAVPDVLDPVFVDPGEKPIRFLNEKGEFEVGRIAAAEKERLPHGSVEAVEQLLIWMPNDPRLLWLLAEVFNASAMEFAKGSKEERARGEMAIRSAGAVFAKLADPLNRVKFGTHEIKERAEKLAAWADLNPERVMAPIPEIEDKTEPAAAWMRVAAISFVTGFAVGLFALWQFQEVRRRRQAR
jgi:hypothetical protein